VDLRQGLLHVTGSRYAAHLGSAGVDLPRRVRLPPRWLTSRDIRSNAASSHAAKKNIPIENIKAGDGGVEPPLSEIVAMKEPIPAQLHNLENFVLGEIVSLRVAAGLKTHVDPLRLLVAQRSLRCGVARLLDAEAARNDVLIIHTRLTSVLRNSWVEAAQARPLPFRLLAFVAEDYGGVQPSDLDSLQAALDQHYKRLTLELQLRSPDDQPDLLTFDGFLAHDDYIRALLRTLVLEAIQALENDLKSHEARLFEENQIAVIKRNEALNETRDRAYRVLAEFTDEAIKAAQRSTDETSFREDLKALENDVSRVYGAFPDIGMSCEELEAVAKRVANTPIEYRSRVFDALSPEALAGDTLIAIVFQTQITFARRALSVLPKLLKGKALTKSSFERLRKDLLDNKARIERQLDAAFARAHARAPAPAAELLHFHLTLSRARGILRALQ
jgi:hypothetical protein